MLDQKNNLITVNILITSLQDNVDYREKLHINHFWELRVNIMQYGLPIFQKASNQLFH